MNPLSVSYRKTCSVMHQLRNRKANQKNLLIMVNCFSLRTSIFNKRNNCTFICFMLLRYVTFLCLVDLILIHYVLWQIAKDFLSFEQITETESQATPGLKAMFSELNYFMQSTWQHRWYTLPSSKLWHLTYIVKGERGAVTARDGAAQIKSDGMNKRSWP
jgi:hypothetical protein